jgi:dihydropteroate synthase
MGIVNVTPDSFSDGGDHFDHNKAIDHGLHLLEQGADILDIGGESTRPGARVANLDAVPEGEELRRILPVLEGVLKSRPNAIISVDTYKSCVAKAAIESGAELVNDVSAGQWDRTMLRTISQAECAVVLNHTRGRPDEWKSLPKEPEIIALIKRELGESAEKALAAGINRDRIVLDPGFGFGKGFDENYAILANFDDLAELGFPLLAGVSRKGFIARTLAGDKTADPDDIPPSERLFGTVAGLTACILKGAHIVRVHDVRAARDAALVADEILKAR